MFHICQNKGFQIEFPNGYIVSVQFGAGNYCENYNHSFRDDSPKSSNSAEVAVIKAGCDMLDLNKWHTIRAFEGLRSNNSDVEGYCTPIEVAQVIDRVSKWEK